MIGYIGMMMMLYTMLIRPFTTKTKINDTRMDNLYWFVGSLFLLLVGFIFGI
jgi:predicted permease